MAECLRIISESISEKTGGKYVCKSLRDILDPSPETPEETADNVIQRIKGKMNDEPI